MGLGIGECSLSPPFPLTEKPFKAQRQGDSSLSPETPLKSTPQMPACLATRPPAAEPFIRWRPRVSCALPWLLSAVCYRGSCSPSVTVAPVRRPLPWLLSAVLLISTRHWWSVIRMNQICSLLLISWISLHFFPSGFGSYNVFALNTISPEHITNMNGDLYRLTTVSIALKVKPIWWAHLPLTPPKALGNLLSKQSDGHPPARDRAGSEVNDFVFTIQTSLW